MKICRNDPITITCFKEKTYKEVFKVASATKTKYCDFRAYGPTY